MKFLYVFLIVIVLAVILRIAVALLFPPQLITGQEVSFETTLLSEPSSHGNYDSVTVQYTKGWSSRQINVYLDPGSGLHYGQVVAISGKIKVKVLENGRAITAISMPHFKIENEKENFLLQASFALRQKIQALYENAISQREAALLLGITLGVRGNFSKTFLSDLQATGVMHVIAASGMNVTMVSGFFIGFFAIFLKRKQAIAVTILILLLYCVLSGLQASILRATVMIAFALGAQLFGRQYTGLYGLFLAACGMLLYNPLWILDVGFQLSFAATLGIFFIKPLLPQWKVISDDIGTTISAQIATVPILVASFGTYGLLSILVNALVLWTVPLLMILGGVGGLLGLIFPFSGKLFLFVAVPLLSYFVSVVTFFGGLNLQLTISSVPVVMVVGYYCLVISLVWVLKYRTKVVQHE